MYYLFLKFCANTRRLYWWHTYPFCWSCGVSRLEYRRDDNHLALYYPCIRGLFPQSSNCWTISEAPYPCRIFDTLYCRTLYGYNWVFPWCSSLPLAHRALRIYRTHDRNDAEKKHQLEDTSIHDMELWSLGITPSMTLERAYEVY